MVVVTGNEMERFVRAGEVVVPEVDSVLMGEARYLRYRRAVADRILEESVGR